MAVIEPQRSPELSVVVPTFGRPELVARLVDRLDRQTLERERFEVILVDDGSPAPLEVAQREGGCRVRVLRQENAGPAAARNLGTEHAHAPLVLFLNDDALPAPDVLERHVRAHREHAGRIAVLGAFPFAEHLLSRPFVRILTDTDLLFDFPGLEHGKRLGWSFFWTCNISLPTAALRAVGGFDAELFREAIVEDVELGYRLEKLGYEVLYLEDIVCEHDHDLRAESYFRRMERLGVNLARMYRKHDDPRVLWCPSRSLRSHLAAMQASCENYRGVLEETVARLTRVEAGDASAFSEAALASCRQLVRRIGFVPFSRGVLRELEGHDPYPVIEHGPPAGELTSIVVVCHEALDQTRRCLEALRAAADPDHPVQLVFVDNGSTDGTPEFLAEQPDVELVRNAANEGAPRARNQGLALCRGEVVAFLDNDVMVTRGWLARLLYHVRVDGRSGAVSCLADRAAHEQEVELPNADRPGAAQAFADERARTHARQCRPAGVLSSFVLVVRREVLEVLGGFDERFSPWGFEDDDFSLRASLAGFRNRIALDVFVRHEPYTGRAKAEAHGDLLARNWKRFAEKWGLTGEYGDYTGLDALHEREFAPDALHVAPPTAPSPTAV